MKKDDFLAGYKSGLAAAALMAERRRDAYTQTFRDREAEGAESVRALIQELLDEPSLPYWKPYI